MAAVLEGRIGGAATDNSADPQCARLTLGPFALMGGDSGTAGAEKLVAGLEESVAVVIADSGWREIVRRRYPEAKTEQRTSFSHDRLDAKTLQPLVAAVSTNIEITRLNLEQARRMSEDVHPDLLGVYGAAEDLLSAGGGFCAIAAARVLSAATVAIAAEHAIEIQINTKKSARGQGLATAVSAALIIHCLERGIEPHWSTADPVSERLATRHGYVVSHRHDWLILK